MLRTTMHGHCDRQQQEAEPAIGIGGEPAQPDAMPNYAKTKGSRSVTRSFGNLLTRRLVAHTVAIALMGPASVSLAAASGADAMPALSDDPAIVRKLGDLPAGHGLRLPRFRVLPTDAAKWHGSFKNGPGRRDFSNKMVYAPDRQTAMYCGANHNAPHRMNDVWEFHLASNTWRLVSPPASDYFRLNALDQRKKKAQQAIKKGRNVEKNRRFVEEIYPARVRKWYEDCCVLADGYLQAKANGGPFNPRHTWDGVTYDYRTRRLYWAVLDYYLEARVRRWAKLMGRDPDEAAAAIKPGASMYIFDPSENRWRRQAGEPPFPRMHGMGGTLVYLPDRDVTLWYVAATNRTPNDFGMWQYDAKSNRWTKLLSARQVRSLVHKAGVAPGEELQTAYSPRHGKLVAVRRKGTFIYDVAGNHWSRAADTPGFGHDAHGVFAYDSNADVFLLVSRDGYRSNKPWQVHAYDLKTDSWQTVSVAGDGVPDDTKRTGWQKYAFAGYYDPGHNVLVLYNGRTARTWVYRHAPSNETSEPRDAKQFRNRPANRVPRDDAGDPRYAAESHLRPCCQTARCVPQKAS